MCSIIFYMALYFLNRFDGVYRLRDNCLLWFVVYLSCFHMVPMFFAPMFFSE